MSTKRLRWAQIPKPADVYSLATCSSNNAFALTHVGSVSLSGNFNNDGSKFLEKNSDASLGNNDGKWSTAHTDNFGPAVVSTGTVGSLNVVAVLYTGIGLCGFVVSVDTSTMVLNFLVLLFNILALMKGGIGWDK